MKYNIKNTKTDFQKFKIKRKANIHKLQNKTKQIILKYKTFTSKSTEKNSLFSKALIKELLFFDAFNSGFTSKVHPTYDHFIIAFKNNNAFYKIPQSLGLLSKALRFLEESKKISVSKNVKSYKKLDLIFVGNPENIEEEYTSFFKGLKCHFVPNESWKPGFLTKKIVNQGKRNKKIILFLYNPYLNFLAYHEALKTNTPIVGLLTPNCDIRGVDYPLILNLKNADLWYPTFCKLIVSNSK